LLEPAPIPLRVRAATIDHVLVVAVTAAVIVEAIVNNRHQLAISVPPPLDVSSSYPLFRNIAVPVVLLATWLRLALLEARHGRTPGKALVGLRAVSDDGTPITLRQSLTRHAIIQAGPSSGSTGCSCYSATTISVSSTGGGTHSSSQLPNTSNRRARPGPDRPLLPDDEPHRDAREAERRTPARAWRETAAPYSAFGTAADRMTSTRTCAQIIDSSEPFCRGDR
jgi:hypothetical protein